MNVRKLLVIAIAVLAAMLMSCNKSGRKTENMNDAQTVTTAETSVVETETQTDSVANVETPSAQIADSFTDPRDNQTYRIVTIGGLTWFAQNLNYQTENSWCYGDDNGNCEKYGRLYTWAAAMNIDSSFNRNLWNGNDAKHQGICPVGWRVPSSADWDALTTAVGGVYEEVCEDDHGGVRCWSRWNNAGTKLKSQTGCYDADELSSPGTDDFGFSALPGGYRWSGGSFHNIGWSGGWRSATEYDADLARGRHMNCDNDYVHTGRNSKVNAFSVRCVTGDAPEIEEAASAADAELSSSVGAPARLPGRFYPFEFAEKDPANGFTTDMFERTVGRNGVAINYGQSARIYGWSRNGLVAYSTNLSLGAFADGINYVILNLVTDRVVFKAEFSVGTEPMEDEELDKAAEAERNRHYANFRQAMRTHGIIEEQLGEYRPFPINHGGAVFNVEIRPSYINRDRSSVDIGTCDDALDRCCYCRARINGYTLIMRRSDGQSKTIANIRNINRMDVYVGGYFVSPHENRALVVMLEKQDAVREETYVAARFIGAHLETGFR